MNILEVCLQCYVSITFLATHRNTLNHKKDMDKRYYLVYYNCLWLKY